MQRGNVTHKEQGTWRIGKITKETINLTKSSRNTQVSRHDQYRTALRSIHRAHLGKLQSQSCLLLLPRDRVIQPKQLGTVKNEDSLLALRSKFDSNAQL